MQFGVMTLDDFAVWGETGQILGGWRLTDTTLYVTIEPCPMCAGALVQARVPHLSYGAPTAKPTQSSLYTITEAQRLNHRLEVTGGIMAKEAANPMRLFFKSRR
jgi:tRNA(adenine34) deaminase